MGKSHQKGWVVARGKKWYGYFRRTVLDPTSNQPKSSIVPVVLGPKAQLTKFEAREALEREISKLTGQSAGSRAMNDGSVTFGWFVRNRFFPLKEAHWKEETAKVKKLLIQQDLIEEFENVPLENFDKFTLQVHLNKLAKTLSKDRVLQMRAYMRDIFAEAAGQDCLAKDPGRKVRVPTQLRETDKTTLTWNQLRKALSELGARDRLLLELDMTNALRPGELLGLKWKCFNQEASFHEGHGNCLQGENPSLGQDQTKPRYGPFAKGSDSGTRRVETSVSRSVSRRLHLPEPRRRLSGHGQLSQAGSAQVGQGPETAETDFPGDTENDCDAGPEEGHSKGRAGRASAFPHSDHGRCLYAGNSRERADDGQFDPSRVEDKGQVIGRRRSRILGGEAQNSFGEHRERRIGPRRNRSRENPCCNPREEEDERCLHRSWK